MIIIVEFLVVVGIVTLTTLLAFVVAILLIVATVFLWNRGFFDD